MDLQALGETIVAVGLTPVVSIGMAVAVVAGIIAVTRRLYRR